MKPTITRLTILFGALVLALNFSIANAQEEEKAGADSAKEEEKAGADAAKEEEKAEADAAEEEEDFDVEVKITGNDLMQYDKKAFTVESGQKVKLTFENIGKLPKAAMGHNVVILKKGVNKVEFATASITAGLAADYLPEEKKSEILAHTKLLGPAEVDSIIFTAPDPGQYDYICTFPAHFAVMNGVMTVK